jgi:hypothetical protein
VDHDHRYECSLAAALVIIDFFQSNPGIPKHELLATVIFAILHAMDRYEEERSDRRAVEFSAN